jgi:hypothetical protein
MARCEPGSIYLDTMARRLLGFVLAFVIIGGPVAAGVCEAACTEHAGHSLDSTVPPSHDHHSAGVVRQPSHRHHSDVVPAAAAERATLMAPGCGHPEAIVSEARVQSRASLATAVMTGSRAARLRVLVVPTLQMDSRHRPPPPIRSTSALRI